MRFCSLGSGSSGNAAVVESTAGGRPTRVLLDCGFSIRELAARLARRSIELAELDAVFVTHEHGDHVGCAIALARQHSIPLWMSRGTWRAIGSPRLDGLVRFARDGEAIDVGTLRLDPYTVAHDAWEPLQVCFSDARSRLGVLTDAGCMTEHAVNRLRHCDGLLLECNHDRDMLAAAAYPPGLKARIGGRFGHLSNDIAAQVLSAARHAGLRHVVAAHLSERNNRPELALAALAVACDGAAPAITVADAPSGTGWIELS